MNSKERFIFFLALTGLVMSLVMTCLSAYIRLAESSIGCEPWPACQAEHFSVDTEPGITIATTDDNKGLRVLHRFMASTFGFVAILLAILNLWYRKQLSFKPTLSIICFALTMLLAMVGMVTPDILHPAVTLINLTAGMLTTAVLWLLVLRIRRSGANNKSTSSLDATRLDAIKPGAQQANPLSRWLALINVWLVIAVIASGAWLSANFASGACPGFPGCELASNKNLVEAYKISRELKLTNGTLALGDVQSTISRGHHLLSALLFAFLLVASYQEFRTAPLASVITITIAIGVIFLGMMDAGLIGNDQPTVLSAWLHNFYSMLLLLTVLYNRERIQ